MASRQAVVEMIASISVSQIIDGDRWRAVQVRNQQLDGSFVYGVLSTKIYCRPSCPSRRPSQDQTVFFGEPREAEDAGFRECLRCRPREKDAYLPQMKIVREACAFMDRNPDSRVTLKALSRIVGVGPFHQQRTFKRVVGISPRQYAEKQRLERAKLLLRRGESVRRSTYGSGHNSMSWLYSRAGAGLGMSPSAYKDGGAGMRIRYCITPCRIGRLLVAGTKKGVCAVNIGDSDQRLESRLWREYPKAEIANGAEDLEYWVRRIAEYLDGDEPSDFGSPRRRSGYLISVQGLAGTSFYSLRFDSLLQ